VPGEPSREQASRRPRSGQARSGGGDSRKKERERKRERERRREREGEREKREREREREREKKTEKKTERQTETQRQRENKRGCPKFFIRCVMNSFPFPPLFSEGVTGRLLVGG
jgi:hypothetical protein